MIFVDKTEHTELRALYQCLILLSIDILVTPYNSFYIYHILFYQKEVTTKGYSCTSGSALICILYLLW